MPVSRAWSGYWQRLFKLMGFRLSLETVIIGHATALLSVVVTQVFARLQRLNRNLEEAAADLG